MSTFSRIKKLALTSKKSARKILIVNRDGMVFLAGWAFMTYKFLKDEKFSSFRPFVSNVALLFLS